MNTISGLSFYDSLNKMTIGALVLLLIDRSSEDIEYGAVSMFLFIVTAFIVGCFFQTIVQIITGDTPSRVTLWMRATCCLTHAAPTGAAGTSVPRR